MNPFFGPLLNADRRRPAPRPAKRPAVESLEERTPLSEAAAVPVVRAAAPPGIDALVVRLNPGDLRTVQVSLDGGASFRPAPLAAGPGRAGGAFVVAGANAARPPFAYVVLQDLNGDGVPDLAANFGSTVEVKFGRPDGTFAFALELAQNTEAAPLSVSVGDFTADGKTDILTLSTTRDGVGLVSLLRGNGDGT